MYIERIYVNSDTFRNCREGIIFWICFDEFLLSLYQKFSCYGEVKERITQQ